MHNTNISIPFLSSLTKDMTGKDDNYRGPAVRALCQITDVRMTLLHLLQSLSFFFTLSHHYLHFPLFCSSLSFSCIVCSFTMIFVHSWKSRQMFFYVLSNQPLLLWLPCRPPCYNLLSATWSRRSLTRFPVCPALPWCHLWYVSACRIYEIGEKFWVFIVQQDTFLKSAKLWRKTSPCPGIERIDRWIVLSRFCE